MTEKETLLLNIFMNQCLNENNLGIITTTIWRSKSHAGLFRHQLKLAAGDKYRMNFMIVDATDSRPVRSGRPIAIILSFKAPFEIKIFLGIKS